MEPSGLCSADAESVGPAGGVEVGIVAGAEAVTASRGSLSDDNILARISQEFGSGVIELNYHSSFICGK